MKTNDALVYHHDIEGEAWEQNWLFISDLHLDSQDCDRNLLKRHLNQSIEKNANIGIFGDVFDAMGGKYDPRTNKGHVKPEYQKENYFDLIVEDAVKFFKPYAHLIKFITIGNHEYSVTKRHEIDLIKRLIKDLNPEIDYGHYTGFVRFKFARNKGNRSSKVMYYTHGSGGNSPVTRGVTKTNRRAVSIDADFFVSGHIHQTWNVPIPRMRLNDANNIVEYVQEHIQLATYKRHGDWEKAKEFGASIRGGYWMRFYHTRENDKTNVKYDLSRAQ